MNDKNGGTVAEDHGSDRPLLGIVLMVLGMLLIPLMDACAKWLAVDHSVMQVAWARFSFHFIWLLPLLLVYRVHWWRIPPLPGVQIARSVLLLLATLCFFAAIRDNPIPVALALLFCAPLVVTLLAPLMLGEQFHGLRLAVAVMGFAGVLLVLRPGAEDFDPSVVFALGAGISYALYIIATRRVSQLTPPLLTLVYTAVVGMLVLSACMPWFWNPPSLKSWGLMGLMGMFAAIGHFLIIKACEYADASLLAPFNYTELVGATGVGYFVFGYFPDAWVWAGIAIISGSGLYLSIKELRRPRIGPEVVDI